MSIKLIAIGCRLMGDDGVAIHVAEKVSKGFKDIGIETIIGETDFQYSLNQIEMEDYLILMDATFFGIELGAITTKSLKEIYKFGGKHSAFSQHGYSLIRALESYYPSMDGFVIGIEGKNFDFTTTLSRGLEEKLEDICKKVEIICKRALFK